MECYNYVIKLSDEQSMSEDLYEMYKKKINEMLTMVEKALALKASNSNAFLVEYVD